MIYGMHRTNNCNSNRMMNNRRLFSTATANLKDLKNMNMNSDLNDNVDDDMIEGNNNENVAVK